MSFAPGTRLGVYEVRSILGAGGMGEVYRARDTNLGRDVAVKVVSADFARDPERVARFQREAQLLATLNHPNIASIYGLEGAEGSQVLVMELVDGDTLAERLSQVGRVPLSKGEGMQGRPVGATGLPIAEALAIARQVADALQAAHEKSIIHRDLKPANIKITPDGTAKVLDFGLGKLIDPLEDGPYGRPDDRSVRLQPDITASPTITSPAMATGVGVLLGTAAYMSPEQAKGRPADKRSDVWSFGCVLYEMLTGRRPFAGDDLSDTLAAVLMREPDWHVLSEQITPQIVTLLKGCLEKDRLKRFADMSVAQFLLRDQPSLTRPAVKAAVKADVWRRLTVPIATLVLGGVVGAMAVWFAARPADPRVARFPLTTSTADLLSVNAFDRDVAITPDGSRVVYVGRGGSELLMRALDQIAPISLARGLVRGVFIARDGQWVGFVDNNRTLKKVAITGGPSLTLTALDGGARGATWAPQDSIIFATNNPATGLQRVGASGGAPTVMTRPNRDRGEGDHVWPELLPDGRGVLFTVTAASGGLDAAQIALLDLDTGVQSIVLRGGSHAHYVSTGHLVYAAGGALRAVPFDLSQREVRGTPATVVPRVLTTSYGAGDYSVSTDGSLVYVDAPGTTGAFGADRTLVWVDRAGREESVTAPSRAYLHPRISPDGSRIAAFVSDQDQDLWMWDLQRATLTRLTFGQGIDWFPLWTPDGQRIVFGSAGEGGSVNVFSMSADGTGKPDQVTSGDVFYPTGLSPDGTQVVFNELTQTSRGNVLTVSLEGDRRVQPLLQTPFDEQEGTISPDGRWIAYESDSSGQLEVYVRPFPAVSEGQWQISTAGGRRPLWSRDGRELFYLALPAGPLTTVMRVPVEARSAIWGGGTPEIVFQGLYYSGSQGRTYDVSPDGRRFLMIKDSRVGDANPQIIVVQHWIEELKRLVPTN